METPTFREAIEVGRDLVGDNADPDSDYNRGITELIATLYGPSNDPDDSREIVEVALGI